MEELITTKEAAKLLRRAPQTLRKWSCLGDGPIAPVPFSRKGLLLWRMNDIRKITGCYDKN